MTFLKELHKNNNFILLKKYEGEDITAENDVQLTDLDKDSDKIRICVIIRSKKYDFITNNIINLYF